ncbi:MAG TPA: HAMP domain-containing protein [Anaerolineae bacterium]|nr:HAMP domain-containing protein [Anaerolineae bacterium]
MAILLSRRLQLVIDDSWDQATSIFIQETQNGAVRTALLNINGEMVLATVGDEGLQFPHISDPKQLSDRTDNEVSTYRDDKGMEWFYIVTPVNRDYYILTAVPRPLLPLRSILTNEFIGPLIQVGILAIVFAFFISWIMASWIARPLQHVVISAEALAEGEYQTIPLEGPMEVQQLAKTFNEMSHRVQASVQSQRDFVVNVSHELKTPLTSIHGFAQAIVDGTVKKKDELNKAGNVILSESSRLHRLVNDLLILARLESGTADFQKADIALNELLNNMIDKFELQAKKAGVELKTDFNGEVIVYADGDRLAQVFTNLIGNAIKFTRRGGKITLSTILEEGNVIISVKDTGIGILKKDQNRIFERFYQVDESRKGGVGRGVGLGLSIAKQIVTSQGGDIWVESSPNKGSNFMIKMPFQRPKLINGKK